MEIKLILLAILAGLALAALILLLINVGRRRTTTRSMSIQQNNPQPYQPTNNRRIQDEDGDEGEKLIAARKKTAKWIIAAFIFLGLGVGYFLYLALRFLFNACGELNILMTLRADGEIKAIMRGDNCVRYVVQVENNRIDPQGFDMFKGSFAAYAARLARARVWKLREDPAFVERKLVTDRSGEPIVVNGHYQLTPELKKAIILANTPTVFEELFGVVWVGFPSYKVFVYSFRWLKFGQKKAVNGEPSSEVVIHAREEKVDSLYYRYTQYGVVIEDAETNAGSLTRNTQGGDEEGRISKVRIKAFLVFETVTTNPQKTLFRTAAISSAGDWQQAVGREIRERVVGWLGATDWDTLVEDSRSVDGALLGIRNQINGVKPTGDPEGVPRSPRDLPVSTVRDYGQFVVKITLVNKELLNTQLQEANEKVYKAQRERDAEIARAAGLQAIAAAPILGKAQGYERIHKLKHGPMMHASEQLGKIRVFAPGNSGGLFHNIADQTLSGDSTDDFDGAEDESVEPADQSVGGENLPVITPASVQPPPVLPRRGRRSPRNKR